MKTENHQKTAVLVEYSFKKPVFSYGFKISSALRVSIWQITGVTSQNAT